MANKSPTDILRKEHEKVLKILDSLEKNLENKNLKATERNLLLLEREFKKHSLNKEEKALFPEIEKFMPRDGGPTGMMIIEHKDLVESINNSKNGIKNKNFEMANEIITHIIGLLREHIHKENSILFMIADMHLSREQKNLLLKKFKKIDSTNK